ncbi:MAG: LacI family DNA-binding transcriptional regulator [Caldilineaceae bacterium]
MNLSRVTIGDVARQAGVSKQTVSRVINQHPDVADVTRVRVQQVVDTLGYQPSSIARSLTSGRSQTLGVVGYGLEYFGTSRILSGIEQEANRLGYIVLLCLVRSPEAHDTQKFFEKLLALHVNGIIWAAPEIGTNRSWIDDAGQSIPVPVVHLSTRPRPGQLVVNIDNRRGAFDATSHLLDQGHREVGIITGPLNWWDALQRRLGWEDALNQAGIVADETMIAEGDWSAASGERAFGQLLEQNAQLSAVFACNDQMALGVIRAAHAMNRRIPQDLALVGFDDIPESAYYTPALTTIHQDVVAVGRRSVNAFAHLFDRQEVPAPVGIDSELISTELVIRESSVIGSRSTDQ